MSAMLRQTFLVATLALSAVAIVEEYYTTNAVCKQRHCINPVFPGLHKLDALEKMRWQKYSLLSLDKNLSFCRKFIDYDPALPVKDYSHSWNFTAHTPEDVAMEQDRDAAKLFFYHVSAMGLDAWDYPSPEKDHNMPMSGCVRQVARMACFTYLPKANPKLNVGMDTRYLKPCKSCCENYVRECKVECCDDSVQCVFTRSVEDKAAASAAATGSKVPPAVHAALQMPAGYADFNGPSQECTGAANSRWVGAGVAALMLHVLISMV